MKTIETFNDTDTFCEMSVKENKSIMEDISLLEFDKEDLEGYLNNSGYFKTERDSQYDILFNLTDLIETNLTNTEIYKIYRLQAQREYEKSKNAFMNIEIESEFINYFYSSIRDLITDKLEEIFPTNKD